MRTLWYANMSETIFWGYRLLSAEPAQITKPYKVQRCYYFHFEALKCFRMAWQSGIVGYF